MTPTAELRTVRAVLAYAEQLRNRAQRERDLDPYADPYSPSEGAARKVYQAALALVRRNDQADRIERTDEERADVAAGVALRELAARVVLQERATKEANVVSDRAEKRHARRQRQERAERQAAMAGLSLGTRLDRAVNALALLSETPAQSFSEEGVITSTKERSGPPRQALPPDRYSTLLADARHLVHRLEEELDHARRRTLKETA